MKKLAIIELIDTAAFRDAGLHPFHPPQPPLLRKKVDQPVQDDGAPSGLEEGDHRVLPVRNPEQRAEADVTRVDRDERGVTSGPSSGP